MHDDNRDKAVLMEFELMSSTCTHLHHSPMNQDATVSYKQQKHILQMAYTLKQREEKILLD